ncbi:MAG: glycosyltransferase family 4 protein [Anaerolineae bacterium]|nr:glycosyltransferase family 4 protein [Anaerolineae bacterium]
MSLRIGIDGRTIQDHFPGIGRYTYHLVDALAPLAPGDSIILLHNPRLPNSRYPLADLARHPNVRLLEVPILPFSLAEQLRLPGIARALRLDLFHSPYYIKPYWLPCPSILTLYDIISHTHPSSLPSARARLLFEVTTRLALRSARLVLTLSEDAAKALNRYYRVSPGKIVVTPGAAAARFSPASPEAIAAMRTRYGLPPAYILYLGINKPHKNLVRLVEAWSKVSLKEKASIALVLAGREDTRYSDYRQRVLELGLGAGVRFLGDVAEADLPALYSGALAFSFPSLAEGFGLPVLEAMACGTPVVCSNLSSLPEVVGDAALLIDPYDVDALAAAICRVLADEGLRREMRAKGLIQAATFSWERTARETLAAYRRVVFSI